MIITVQCKVDMVSDGHIMPFYMYKKLFPMGNYRAVNSNNRYKNQTRNVQPDTNNTIGHMQSEVRT